MPLIARTFAQATLIPIGVPLMILALAVVIRRAMFAIGVEPRWDLALRRTK
jgi:hypothetical protein